MGLGPIWPAARGSLTSMGTIFLEVSAGVVLTRLGLLSAEVSQGLGQLVFNLFLPCLIWSKVASFLTPTKLLDWWIIIAVGTVNILLGLAIGMGLVRWMMNSRCMGSGLSAECRKRRETIARYQGVIVFALALSNAGYIPLTLIHSLTNIDGIPELEEDEDAEERGIVFVSVYMIVLTVFLWSVGRALVEGDAHWMKTRKSLLAEVVVYDFEKSEREVAVLRPNGPNGRINPTPEPSDEEEENEGGARRPNSLFAVIVWMWKHLLSNPPLFATALAVLTGLISPLKHILFEADTPLLAVGLAAEAVGDATVPCALLVLGRTLARGPPPSSLPLRVSALIVLFRLLVIPALSFAIVFLLLQQDLLLDDPMIHLTLFLESCNPTALNFVIVCQIAQYAEEEAGFLLFWQYVLAIFTLPLFSTLALSFSYT